MALLDASFWRALNEVPRPPEALTDLFEQNLRSRGVHRVLHTVRKYLGMDVAFVARFRESDRVFEHVDSDGLSAIHAGMELPLDAGYCLKVATGELPGLMPDTSLVPAAAAMPETRGFPIGAHLSVPIYLQSGEVYGTLCCFSHQPDRSLGERDFQMLQAFAEVLAAQVEESTALARSREAKASAIRDTIQRAPRIVYQPIYSLHSGALLGMECLSRFSGDTSRSPSQWFALAEEVGLRSEMEVAAIQKALGTLGSFPPTAFFALNSSPQTILDGSLQAVLQGADLRRLVVEITEHSIVESYFDLEAALRPLRQQGLRVAVDDAGAGFASMRHIVNLQPEFIKLDGSLTAGIDQDPARRALARALVSFSREIGSHIIAEGIETQAELELLQSLDVETGQGFLLHEPVPMDIASRPEMSLCRIRSAKRHLPM